MKKKDLKIQIESLENIISALGDDSFDQVVEIDVLQRKNKDHVLQLEWQQEVMEEQRRTIKALMEGVEEHTGKQGTTAVLTYIARIESELEFWKRMTTAMGWDVEHLLMMRQSGMDSAEALFKAFEND